MKLPENIIVGGEFMGALRDRMKQYVKQLDEQLRELREEVRGQQQIRDLETQNEDKTDPHLPQVGDRVLVRVTPAQVGFAPKRTGPYYIIMTSDTCSCVDRKGKGRWKHWSQLKSYNVKDNG